MHAMFMIEHNMSVGTMFVVQVPQVQMRLVQMGPLPLPARFNMESLHLLYIVHLYIICSVPIMYIQVSSVLK